MGRIHLGTILGTTIELDPGFLFIAALFVISDIQVVGLRYALLWVPVLFISILFHELAHAATIGALGFGPSRILLEGKGGVTINERRARPWQDMLISAAGPAASLLLAWIARWIAFGVPQATRDPFLAGLLPLMITANIWWAIFNMLPVMPLDGSGVFRNLLRMVLEERIAFTIAIWVSILSGSALAGYAGYMAAKGHGGWWLFLALIMIWYVRASYLQWEFFRSIDHTDE